MHNMLSCHLNDTVAMPPERADGADYIRWPKASAQQTDRVQVLNPLPIRNISFAARHVSDILGIHQKHFNAVSFESLVEGNPIDAGRLHRDRPNPASFQPLRQLEQIPRECREPPYGL